MTFAFVSYWHGSYEDLWCWAALNWLGVTVESGVRRLLETPRVRETLVSMVHHCLCCRGQLIKEGPVMEEWSSDSLKCELFLPDNSEWMTEGGVGEALKSTIVYMNGWLDR